LELGTEKARTCWTKWMKETTPEAAALMNRILTTLGYK